jgi:hypothetical protein
MGPPGRAPPSHPPRQSASPPAAACPRAPGQPGITQPLCRGCVVDVEMRMTAGIPGPGGLFLARQGAGAAAASRLSSARAVARTCFPGPSSVGPSWLADCLGAAASCLGVAASGKARTAVQTTIAPSLRPVFTAGLQLPLPASGNLGAPPPASCWPAQRPSTFPGAANCSRIRAQNAGRSSGQRLEVMFWSVTTSRSTALPPALRMSVLTLG